MRINRFALVVLVMACSCAPVPTATPAATPTLFISPTPVPSLVPPQPTASPPPTSTQTPAPSLTPTLTADKRYSTAFGIDYGHPEKYLIPGEQTRLANPAIVDALRRKEQSIAHLGEIYFWIKREFTPWSAGGQTIGAVTVEQLFKERRLGGCHDWGLVYASIARELGYPTVMIDTAGIAWAKGFLSGKKGPYLGHVFVEVFIGGKWVLVDSTNNWYVENSYDPANGVVPLKMGDETEGLFVMRKGVDTWGYGIKSNSELTRLMEDSARQLKVEAIKFPPYNWQRFK